MATIEQTLELEEDELDVVSASKRWGVPAELAKEAIDQIISWQEEDSGFDAYMAEGGAMTVDIGRTALKETYIRPTLYMPVAA